MQSNEFFFLKICENVRKGRFFLAHPLCRTLRIVAVLIRTCQHKSRIELHIFPRRRRGVQTPPLHPSHKSLVNLTTSCVGFIFPTPHRFHYIPENIPEFRLSKNTHIFNHLCALCSPKVTAPSDDIRVIGVWAGNQSTL